MHYFSPWIPGPDFVSSVNFYSRCYQFSSIYNLVATQHSLRSVVASFCHLAQKDHFWSTYGRNSSNLSPSIYATLPTILQLFGVAVFDCIAGKNTNLNKICNKICLNGKSHFSINTELLLILCIFSKVRTGLNSKYGLEDLFYKYGG